MYSVWFFGTYEHGENFLSKDGFRTVADARRFAKKQMQGLQGIYDKIQGYGVEGLSEKEMDDWGIGDENNENLWIASVADTIRIVKDKEPSAIVGEWTRVEDSDGQFRGWV